MDTFTKDPDAVLDYSIDWTSWLGTDTISASTWSSNSTNITIDSDENSTLVTVVWLSGGVAGEIYVLTNHITTAGGREEDRSIKIKMKEK